MNKAHDPINIEEFLNKTKQDLENLPQKDSKILNAHIITISKQMEKLLAATENNNKGNTKQPKNFTLELIITVIIITVIICAITFYLIVKKPILPAPDINNNLNADISELEDILETKNLKNRTFMINKLQEFEKNIAEIKTPVVDPNILKQKLDEFEQKRTAASSLLDRIQKEAAAKILDELEEKKSLFANAYVKMGWDSSLQNNYAGAIEKYKKAIEMNPSYAMPYYNLACCFAKIGNDLEALKWLKKGKPYFDKNIIKTAKQDPDLASIQNDPYFKFLFE